MPQAAYRRGQIGRPGRGKVLKRLGAQLRGRVGCEAVAGTRVLAEVHEHAPSPRNRLDVDEHVDQRRPMVADLPRVERPLIALEENRRREAPHGREELVEEVARVAAILVRAEVARHHLLVRPGHVPPELHRRQPVLRLGEVDRPRARFESDPDRAVVARRIHGALIHAARPAHGEHDVLRVERSQPEAARIERARVECQNADDPAAVGYERHDLMSVEHRHTQAPRFIEQLLDHRLRSQRPDGTPARARRVVGDVPPISAELVVRERNARLDETVEGARGQIRLNQREIAVDGMTVVQLLRHRARRIRPAARDPPRVERLLVRAGVVRRAVVQFLGQHGDLAARLIGERALQRHRAPQSRRPSPDDHGVEVVGRDVQTVYRERRR